MTLIPSLLRKLSHPQENLPSHISLPPHRHPCCVICPLRIPETTRPADTCVLGPSSLAGKGAARLSSLLRDSFPPDLPFQHTNVSLLKTNSWVYFPLAITRFCYPSQRGGFTLDSHCLSFLACRCLLNPLQPSFGLSFAH